MIEILTCKDFVTKIYFKMAIPVILFLQLAYDKGNMFGPIMLQIIIITEDRA